MQQDFEGTAMCTKRHCSMNHGMISSNMSDIGIWDLWVGDISMWYELIHIKWS